jgi:hypothetical protein
MAPNPLLQLALRVERAASGPVNRARQQRRGG